MAFLDKLDIDETLRKRQLVFKSKWIEFADNLIFYVQGSFFIVCMITLYYEVNFSSGNDKVIAYFFLPLGANMASILLPSILGMLSRVPTSARRSANLSRSSCPLSWNCIARPLNRT